MVGAVQNLNSSLDLTTPFQKRFAIRKLALATLLRSTYLPNLKVSISTQYEDIKGDRKCRKLGGLWYLWSFKVTENSTNRQSVYKFLLAFHCNYVPFLHRFCDIALGVTPLEFRWVIVWRYLRDQACDGRTDGRTDT